jgi:predicted DNA-binding protein
MSRKKVSTTIYITPEQADRLKLLHERTKVPIAVFIREGIDMMLKHYEPVLPGQMSLESATHSSITLGEAPRPQPPPSAASRREPVREPAATLRTGIPSAQGSQAGPSRSGEGGG